MLTADLHIYLAILFVVGTCLARTGMQAVKKIKIHIEHNNMFFPKPNLKFKDKKLEFIDSTHGKIDNPDIPDAEKGDDAEWFICEKPPKNHLEIAECERVLFYYKYDKGQYKYVGDSETRAKNPEGFEFTHVARPIT